MRRYLVPFRGQNFLVHEWLDGTCLVEHTDSGGHYVVPNPPPEVLERISELHSLTSIPDNETAPDEDRS